MPGSRSTPFSRSARSSDAAAFFHGSFNALASFALVFLTGAGNIVISPVGLVGIATALILTGACVLHDRYIAPSPLITKGPFVIP